MGINQSLSVKLIHQPEQYARDVIIELTRQLQGVKKISKRIKLESKISQWKKTIECFEENT